VKVVRLLSGRTWSLCRCAVCTCPVSIAMSSPLVNGHRFFISCAALNSRSFYSDCPSLSLFLSLLSLSLSRSLCLSLCLSRSLSMSVTPLFPVRLCKLRRRVCLRRRVHTITSLHPRVRRHICILHCPLLCRSSGTRVSAFRRRSLVRRVVARFNAFAAACVLLRTAHLLLRSSVSASAPTLRPSAHISKRRDSPSQSVALCSDRFCDENRVCRHSLFSEFVRSFGFFPWVLNSCSPVISKLLTRL